MVSQMTGVLATEGLNIEEMVNKSRGQVAYTVFDLNEEISEQALEDLRSIQGIIKVRAVSYTHLDVYKRQIVGNSIILPWIQRDAAVTQGVRMGGSVFGTLKKIFTGPPILAVLLSLALLFLHIRLPKFIMVAVDGIADMTSGLSLCLLYTSNLPCPTAVTSVSGMMRAEQQNLTEENTPLQTDFISCNALEDVYKRQAWSCISSGRRFSTPCTASRGKL